MLLGCWCRLCVAAGQASSLQRAGKKSAGGLLAAAGTCTTHDDGQLWAPLPRQTAGSSDGSIGELSRAQREQKRELFVFVPCFQRDTAPLPCHKQGKTHESHFLAAGLEETANKFARVDIERNTEYMILGHLSQLGQLSTVIKQDLKCLECISFTFSVFIMLLIDGPTHS